MNPTEPRYCDYYGMLSYVDFLDLLAAGTLTSTSISLGMEKP